MKAEVQPLKARTLVILNRGAGRHGEDTEAQIAELFQSQSISTRLLVARNGGEIASLAQEAVRSDAEIIVAAGGDGTIDAIAAALTGTGKILGVLPLGTFNLFAKRLNIPLELGAAVQTVVSGRTAEINVGEVKARTFLHGSSVGLLPLALPARRVAHRDHPPQIQAVDRRQCPRVIGGGSHVQKGAGPDASTVADPPVLDTPGSDPLGGKGGGQVAEVAHVVAGAPKAAVDQDRQWMRRRGWGQAKFAKL